MRCEENIEVRWSLLRCEENTEVATAEVWREIRKLVTDDVSKTKHKALLETCHPIL